jgi:hypothetical protein
MDRLLPDISHESMRCHRPELGQQRRSRTMCRQKRASGAGMGEQFIAD